MLFFGKAQFVISLKYISTSRKELIMLYMYLNIANITLIEIPFSREEAYQDKRLLLENWNLADSLRGINALIVY